MKGFKMDFNVKLIPGLSVEDEWKYLVNETFIGEKCVVPILNNMLLDERLSTPLKSMISLQLDEETEHVRLYYNQIASDKLTGSGFNVTLKKYINSIDKITLKLFAIQAMLEGVALGALKYRLETIQNSYSEDVDKRACLDEIGHVAFSYNLFDDLYDIDGQISAHEFRQVSQDINRIFSTAFDSSHLRKVLKKDFNLTEDTVSDPNFIDEPAWMRFKGISSKTIISNRNTFLQHYFGAVTR